MNTCKWTQEEMTLCQSLLASMTPTEISQELTKRYSQRQSGFVYPRSQEAVERKCMREGWKCLAPRASAEPEKEAEVSDTVEEWALIEKILDKHKESFVQNTRGVIPKEKITRKILSLSDIHFPLANLNLLTQAVEAHRDADIVVCNGDLLEGYVFSTFTKNKSIAALDEYRTAFAFIEMLSKAFPKVVLVDGNHDIRAARALKEASFSKEATSVLRPNLISRIANGERLGADGKLIEKLTFNNVYYQESESWYVRIGKTLFIHPHGSGSGGPGGMVRKHSMRFNTRYNPGEIDSIVCGHTHQVYKAVINNQLLIEQGCLTGFLSYAWGPKADYVTNAQNGYAVIYQDEEGNTDFNLSGPIYLGEVLPPKKSIFTT